MKKSYLFQMSFLSVLLVIFSVIAGCSSSGGDAAAPPLKVFVTSATGTGDLSTWPDAIAAGGAIGLAAGDAVCQAAATTNGVPGTYRAWLSTSTVDAYCHIQGFTGKVSDLLPCGQATLPIAAGPWVRTDGQPFADVIEKLINHGQVYAPVRYDETANSVESLGYWTGTASDGTADTLTCDSWTDGTNASNGVYGSRYDTANGWTTSGGMGCLGPARLLCFQTGTGGPLPSMTPPASSKKVFVTSVTDTGDLTSWTDYSGSATGAAAGDTICQNLASSAGLANAANYKAWLSDSGNDAMDRFTDPGGPWYRLDGVKVADNKAYLIAAGSLTTPLFTAITYTETGVYLNTDFQVWSGTGADGHYYGAGHCNDWASSDGGSYNGTAGLAFKSDEQWTNWYSNPCNNTGRLYCFED